MSAPPEGPGLPERGGARRRAAEATAGRLATPEGLREARRLQGEGRLEELLRLPDGEPPLAPGGEPPPAPEAPRPSAGVLPSSGSPPRRHPEPISIWVPQDDPAEPGRTVFVRPEPGPLGDHYASRRELRPKRSELPLRVALFGESAAAGYLYAPHLTPALVLESQLRAAGGADRFEVIDLARTNERLATLAETVRTSLQIQPDVLVIYAGNNWNLLETPEVSPYAPSVAARLAYARALREEGLAGAGRLAEERIRALAGASLDTVALLARAVGIPVVLVVPEVSLADWETRQPPLWLPGDGLALWHRDFEAALERLEAGDWEGARALAERMAALDGGLCSTSWRLLARALAGGGDLEGAAEAARREIDAAPYATLGFLSAPQTGSLARGILLAKAAEHRWPTVDLRRVCERVEPRNLPGRRLFLDYCHLTSEGMALAMSEVAAEILEVSGLLEGRGPLPTPGEILLSAPLRPSPAAEATARLGAALHTAHRHLPAGPKRPLLERWLEGALEADPGVAEAMLDLLRMRTAPVPAILTVAQRRNFDSTHRLLLQHGLRWGQLDADLLLALAEVLERRGVPAREELEERLVAGFLPPSSGVDLTEPPYLWEPLERFFPDVMEHDDLTPRGFFRSPWPSSSFCLVGDGESGLALEANVRLPPAPGGAPERSGEVVVVVNGEARSAFRATERWTRSGIRLEGGSVPRGLNRLTLRWPMPPPLADPEAPLRAALERLEIGVPSDLHPVYGEIWSLVARPE